MRTALPSLVLLTACGQGLPSQTVVSPAKSETPRVSAVLPGPPTRALGYRAPLTREATFVFGTTAPVPLLAAQIQQESNWDCKVTAHDGGMGCAQFMQATAGWLVKTYPDLGAVNAYDPVWAFQAQARLDKYNYARVQGRDECHRWAATLVAYNAGLGNVQAVQKLSQDPGNWWGATETIQHKQAEGFFKSSRDYPRRIVYKHQPQYLTWGRSTCI